MRALVLAPLILVACATSERETPAVDAGDPCTRVKKGTVTLSIDAEPILQSRAIAAFAESTVSTRAPRCTTKAVAGCSVTECVRTEAPGNDCVATSRSTAAGSISVSGGANPALTMTSDAKRSYAGFSSAGARWAPGDAVTVQAEGGEVPAFEAKLLFPSRVEVQAPIEYVEKRNPIRIDWRTGFALAWKPGVGTVRVHVTQGDPELRKQTDIVCLVPSEKGGFTVPSDTLQYLEGTRDTTTANATIEVAGRAEVALTAGDYAVVVEAVHREAPRQLVVGLEGVTPK